MTKQFRLAAGQIVDLVADGGACMASDRITVDGCAVGYCYREEADFASDSGWRFFAGDETQEYVDNATNFEVYAVNTIANYDPEIIRLLAAPVSASFERPAAGESFRRIGT